MQKIAIRLAQDDSRFGRSSRSNDSVLIEEFGERLEKFSEEFVEIHHQLNDLLCCYWPLQLFAAARARSAACPASRSASTSSPCTRDSSGRRKCTRAGDTDAGFHLDNGQSVGLRLGS